MEEVFNSFKCLVCHFVLQSPIVLPCGNSICQRHVTKHVHKIFQCRLCSQGHHVTEQGFPPNNTINNLIETNFGEYKCAYNSCKSLKTTIEQLRALKNNPMAHINTTIEQLKQQVRARRSELINEVIQKSEQTISELDLYETRCEKALNRVGSTLKCVEMKLERKGMKLERLVEALNTFGENMRDNWAFISEKSELEKEKLVRIMDQVKGILLVNKLDEFKEKSVSFFSKANNCEIINEAQVEVNENSVDDFCEIISNVREIFLRFWF